MRLIKKLTSNKQFSNLIIYGFGQGFNIITPLLIVPHVVAVCGEGGLGKMSLGFAMSLFLILIVDYAFEIKGPKEASENRHDTAKLQQIANITFFSKFIIFTIVAVLSVAIINTVPFFTDEKPLFLFSLSIVFAQVFNPVWFLQGVENFRLTSILNILSKITYVVLVYAFITDKSSYIYINLLLGGTTLVFNLFGLYYITHKYSLKVAWPGFDVIKAILKADFSICLSQLALSARQLSPMFIVAYFLGYYQAGQYKIIEQVTSMFRTFIQVYLRFFYPSLCLKVSVNASQGFAYWKKYVSVSVVSICLPLIVLYFGADYLLMFFNTSQHTIDTIGTIFRISLLIPLLMGLSMPLEQLMFAVNQNKVYVRIALAVTAITIALVLATVTTYGIEGIIVSLIFSELLFIGFYFKYSYLFLNNRNNHIGTGRL